MTNKQKAPKPFVYVSARIWTGVDIDGLIAIPRDEFMKRWRECRDSGYPDSSRSA